MTEPGMINIYWTKIKLQAVANQAIYLVIFLWVSRKFISELVYFLLILLLDRYSVFKREEWSV